MDEINNGNNEVNKSFADIIKQQTNTKSIKETEQKTIAKTVKEVMKEQNIIKQLNNTNT